MNKYDLKRTCGKGSFAVVYEAVRRSDGVRVAVKKIKTPQPSWQACLHLRELRSFKTVGSHPHVVALLELVLEKKLLHFVFEFCDSNLYEFLSASSSPLPPARAAEMLAQLLSGVGHIHAHGFMHRDLKPENVLCDAAATHLKVADLGLARELRSRPPYRLHRDAWYRAPERAARAAVRPQIDVWALGCIGAELLTRAACRRERRRHGARWSRCSARSMAAGTRVPRSRAATGCGRPRAARRRCRSCCRRATAPTSSATSSPGTRGGGRRAAPPRPSFVKATAAARCTFNARGSSSTASAVTAAPPAVAATPLARVSSAAAALSPPKPSAPTRPPTGPVKSSPARISPPPTASGRGPSAPPARRALPSRASHRPVATALAVEEV